MRNRIAHGYLSINLETVWDTTQTAIPDLLDRLLLLQNWHAQGE
ncbi:HepT-like ribonuclease domain-containing protein [Agrobacterium tumefaciens]